MWEFTNKSGMTRLSGLRIKPELLEILFYYGKKGDCKGKKTIQMVLSSDGISFMQRIVEKIGKQSLHQHQRGSIGMVFAKNRVKKS